MNCGIQFKLFFILSFVMLMYLIVTLYYYWNHQLPKEKQYCFYSRKEKLIFFFANELLYYDLMPINRTNVRYIYLP